MRLTSLVERIRFDRENVGRRENEFAAFVIGSKLGVFDILTFKMPNTYKRAIELQTPTLIIKLRLIAA
jgi:hypothetical protein